MTTVNGRKELKWKNNKLYYDGKKVGSVILDKDTGERNPGYEDYLYKIKWMDDTVSKDFYNLTRAKDNLVEYTLSDLNRNVKKPTEKPADAFKSEIGT